MIKGIQVLGIFVGLYLIGITILEYNKGQATIKRTTIFIVLWGIMVLFFANTRLVGVFMPILSTENNVLTAIVVGVLILFLLYLDIYRQLNSIQKDLSILTQNIALKYYQDTEKENMVE